MSSGTQETIPLPDLPGIEKGWELLTVEAEDSAFSGCTGGGREHIRRKRAIVEESLAVGISVRKIAEALGVSRQSVRAIRAEAWKTGKLDHLKERLGRDYMAVADLMRAEAMDRIEEIPAGTLLLASCQSADKGLLLLGAPTARVEVNHVTDHASLNAWLDSLPRAQPVNEGENSAQKRAPVDVQALPSGSGAAGSPDYQSGYATRKSLSNNGSREVLQQEHQKEAGK